LESTSERRPRAAATGGQLQNLTESSRNHVRASPVISVLVAAAAGYGISKLLVHAQQVSSK
jgi:hypothetical protein